MDCRLIATDFDAMIDRCLAAYGDNLVLSVALPAHLHRRLSLLQRSRVRFNTSSF